METLPRGYRLIPTIVLPAAGSCISSCRPLVAPPSHPVIMPAGCCVPSRCATYSCFCCAALSSSCHASWFLHILLSSCCATLSSCHHAGWLLHRLLLRHPLVLLLRHPLILSLCQLIVASPLVVLLMCHPHVLSSHRLVVALPLLAPPSRPLIVPPSC